MNTVGGVLLYKYFVLQVYYIYSGVAIDEGTGSLRSDNQKVSPCPITGGCYSMHHNPLSYQ